jgi:cystathionine gamma-lyase
MENQSDYIKTLVSEFDKQSELVKKHDGFGTKAIHAGQEPDSLTGGVNVGIQLSTTYAQKYPGEPIGQYDYSRCGNPCRNALEQAVAACEYAKFGMAFSSGCAAMTCIMLTLNQGDHILVCDDVYGGTQRYIRRIAEERGMITATFVDMTNPENVKNAITDKTKLVWIETPTNPTLKVCDIEEICKICKEKGILTIGDNTFASPYLQSPLQLGCDISLNSVSKYIGGHSDVIMGFLTMNDAKLQEKLFFVSKTFGGCPSPFECYLALRGLKTLKVRMEAHCKNAMAVAKYLEKSDKIEKTVYPGLESHPQHAIAKKQMRGFSGMITFYLKGGLEESRKFLSTLKVITLAESLGGVESLIECPAVMTHGSVPPEKRKELNISDNMIRLSVGIEDLSDLLGDIENALSKI